MEIDHFFILVDKKAKIADQLIELGLQESYSRDHPGQGTANRCFKFSNNMMELLWLRDEEEANNGPASGLYFPQRLSNEQASPFGLIFTPASEDETSMPFSGWSYQPDYFPAPNAFHVASNSDILEEPLCIYVPFMGPVERKVEVGKFKSISQLKMIVPVESLSEQLFVTNQVDGFSVESGHEHLLEVTFDQHACGLSKDLRPGLPLILHW